MEYTLYLLDTNTTPTKTTKQQYGIRTMIILIVFPLVLIVRTEHIYMWSFDD